eukprot:gene6493-11949_t
MGEKRVHAFNDDSYTGSQSRRATNHLKPLNRTSNIRSKAMTTSGSDIFNKYRPLPSLVGKDEMQRFAEERADKKLAFEALDNARNLMQAMKNRRDIMPFTHTYPKKLATEDFKTYHGKEKGDIMKSNKHHQLFHKNKSSKEDMKWNGTKQESQNGSLK